MIMRHTYQVELDCGHLLLVETIPPLAPKNGVGVANCPVCAQRRQIVAVADMSAQVPAQEHAHDS